MADLNLSQSMKPIAGVLSTPLSKEKQVCRHKVTMNITKLTNFIFAVKFEFMIVSLRLNSK